jgi:glycosyltransferase involved in cell wall biosynthesis
MRSSKIFLSSSRYESFGLAAAEALACGCLSVGPKGLSSTEYFRFLTGMKPPRDDDLEAELEQVAAYVNQGLSPAAEGLLLARAALAPEKIAAALAERI